MSDEVEWEEPRDENGLWERQTGSLTVRSLLRALSEVSDADLPIEVAWYDGSGTRELLPMHLDVRAVMGRPTAVVLTVA